MIHITVTTMDGTAYENTYNEGITPAELAGMVPLPYDVLSCRINNENKRLDEPLYTDCKVELLDMRDNYANMSYQSTLVFLYVSAVHAVLKDKADVIIANSLSKGLFTTIGVRVDDDIASRIETLMKQWVEEDIPFEEIACSERELEECLSFDRHKERRRLLDSSNALESARLYRFKDQEDLFYMHLLPSSGYLKYFELRRYRSGILLRFPEQRMPDVIPPYKEQKLLYEAFSEETLWEHLLNIDFAADLNASMLERYQEVIMVSEALHEKKIAEIAGRIAEEKKRIILIAGPSSSGKTSFAKRLSIQLQVCGLKPLYLGTDDYFINRGDMRPDETGKIDFEALDAVDTKLFADQMNALLLGETVDIPVYDFIEGRKKYGTRITSIRPSQPIVIEGIHGLNPKLTENIADSEKFRIYISPLTSLNIDAHHRVPTTDARMLRRMIRDNRTRGRSASETINGWKDVRNGEEKWIFPYNDTADAFFNSSLIYELAVLRKYAEPLLLQIPKEDTAYPEAQRMLDFIRFFAPVPDDTCIVSNSILREFIGGSILVD